MAFHETRFPTAVSFRSRGGPRRKTIVASQASGYEQANQQWADSRREYNAGYGIKDQDDLYQVLTFFEERKGRFHQFRWKDRMDWKSGSPGSKVSALDQVIGTGDGSTVDFQLKKAYGVNYDPWTRDIKKPVQGTVKIAVDGVEQTTGWTVDTTTGIVTFSVAPLNTLSITAGYEFDVPVRFDTDVLDIDWSAFSAGEIPNIPIIEVRL